MSFPVTMLRRVMSSAFFRMGPGLRRHAAGLVERNYEEITYRRLSGFGYSPKTIIDVGAYRGDWTRMVHRVFGPRPTLMVEAQRALVPGLLHLAQSCTDIHVANAVLGARDGGSVSFYEMGTGSSMFAEASNAPRQATRLTTRRLDAVADEYLGDAGDIFLKIDVQGAELEVLAGAEAVLRRASLVQLELAMLAYNEGAPLLPEVVGWMAERGWLPTEISGFSRPGDRLVQIDMLFTPRGSPLRPDHFNF